MTQTGKAAALREAAARARRMAASLSVEADRVPLLAFATELEAEATALETAPPEPDDDAPKA